MIHLFLCICQYPRKAGFYASLHSELDNIMSAAGIVQEVLLCAPCPAAPSNSPCEQMLRRETSGDCSTNPTACP